MDNNEISTNSETSVGEIYKLNELIVTQGDGYERYLSQLTSDGWIVGDPQPGQALVLPDGRLLPIGTGGHDALLKKYKPADQDYGPDNVVQDGGMYLGNRLIVGLNFGACDQRVLNQLVKFAIKERERMGWVDKPLTFSDSTIEDAIDIPLDDLRSSNFNTLLALQSHGYTV